MGKLEPLNLATRARHPDFYDKSRDMETALAWNAIKKILVQEKREELFAYIQSVRLTEKNIVITTEKPIVNSELKMHSEAILTLANTSLGSMGFLKRIKVRFS